MFSDGFEVADQRLPWGTTLAAAQMLLPSPLASDERSAKFRSTHVFGLTGILSATLRAPAQDRPVLQVEYDWSLAAGDAVQRLTTVFGSPQTSSRHDISGFANPAWGVGFSAHWQFPAFRLGVSVYGAPRATSAGTSSALVYVHWEDMLAAAKPYTAAMRRSVQWLDAAAAFAETIATLTLEIDQPRPRILGGPAEPSDALLQAWRLMYKRRLYATPEYFARTLLESQVLLWRNSTENIWGVSTRYETVFFPLGSIIAVSHVNMLPAKGSGGTLLTVGDLSLESTPSSPTLAQLVALLEENHLAKVSFMEEYDA